MWCVRRGGGPWQLLWMLGDHLLNMAIDAPNTPKSMGNTVASEQAVWPKEKELCKIAAVWDEQQLTSEAELQAQVRVNQLQEELKLEREVTSTQARTTEAWDKLMEEPVAGTRTVITPKVETIDLGG